MATHKTSIVERDEDRRLVRALARHLGISQSAVRALALRCLAQREGVQVSS